MRVGKWKFGIFMVVLLSSLVVAIPVMHYGLLHVNPQDTFFTVARVIGLTNVWQSPVNFEVLGYHGQIVNSFYPWWTLLPVTVIYHLLGNISMAYIIFSVISSVVTFYITSYSYASVFKKYWWRYESLAVGFVYTFATYRLDNLYFRYAVGEALAMTFFPLLVAGFYLAAFGDFRKYNWMLIVGFVGVGSSHLVSLLITLLIGFVYVLTSFYWWTNKRVRIINLMKSAVITGVILMPIVISMMIQTTNQKIFTPLPPTNMDGQKLADLFTNALNNTLAGHTIGFLALILFGIALIKRISSSTKMSTDLDGWFIVVMVTFFATTALFPWEFISKLPGLNILDRIQYVWRLNGILVILIAFYAVRMIKISWIRLVAIMMVTVTFGFVSVYHEYADNSSSILTEKMVLTGAQNAKYMDYRTEKSVQDVTIRKLVEDRHAMINGKNVPLKIVNSPNNVEVYLPMNMMEEGRTRNVVLPYFAYTGAKVVSNNGNLLRYKEYKGLISIKPSRTVQKVIISYTYSIIQRIAYIISGLMMTVMMLFWLLHGRFTKK